MNRDRITIDWRFTRRKARLKFGYKRIQIMRSPYQLGKRETQLSSGRMSEICAALRFSLGYDFRLVRKSPQYSHSLSYALQGFQRLV